MPRVTVRKDGTAFIRAKVHPGSDQVRAWEVTRKGIAWLRRRGIGVKQEMGRGLFDQLRKLGFAYITRPSGKRTPTTHRRRISRASVEPNGVRVQREQGPNGERRIITIPASLIAPTPAPRRKKRAKADKADQGRVPGSENTGTASQESASPAIPAHWRRRTKKKDWFGKGHD